MDLPVEVIGPYRLFERLGQGAMGVVYRAWHAETGATVALKTVHVTRGAALAGIRREIHALSRLRHPGVVRIVDQGIVQGRPWYAMELVMGPTLAMRFDALWSRRPDAARRRDPAAEPEHIPAGGGRLATVLELIRQICEPLAFIHGEGLVHGDLKPGNVLFAASGAPLLVDFGLVTRASGTTGRERLDVLSFESSGTPAYMAPEQIRGDTLDARADLYALGCMLYEGVVGFPPFASFREQSAVLRAHLSYPSPPPSTLCDGVPPALEQLIAGLLAKDPRERIGHARDVADALDALGTSTAIEPERRTKPYLYRPALQGRAAALRELVAQLDAVEAGETRVVLVAGESGVGKTRLVQELARVAVHRALPVVAGECAAVASQREPLAPLRPLLAAAADRCVEVGAGEVARVFGPHLKLLARHEPTLLAVPGAADQPEPLELAGEAGRVQVLAALDRVAEALSRAQPMVLVVDDVQWADELTLAWLEWLARGARRDRRLLVLATYRVEEPLAALDALVAEGHVSRLDLRGLGSAEVSALVSEMLAMRAPPAALVDFLARGSEGNPFFVSEYLRLAVSEGLLTRDHGRWALAGAAGPALEQLPTPGALSELVGRRLDGLPRSTLALIEAGAVLGRAFQEDELRAVSGLASDEVLEALAILERHAVLEETASGALRFVHDQLRNVAYARVPAERRSALHRRAAEALAAAIADVTGGARVDTMALARHWELGGVAERAVLALEATALEALRSGATRQAIDCLERTIALAPSLPEPATAARRARWHRWLADARFAAGDLDGTERSCVAALAEAGVHLPSGKAGWAWCLMRALLRQSLHAVLPRGWVARGGRDAELLEEAALAAVRFSERHLYSGRPLELAAASPMAVNLAERAGRPIRVARAYAGTAFLARVNRLPRVSKRYFQAADRVAEETRDVDGRAFARMCRAAADAGEGHFGAALDGIERALADACEIGEQVQIATLETLRGHVEYFRGDLDASRESFRGVLESGERRGNAQHRAWGLVGLGRACAAAGDPSGAIAALEQALAILASHPDFPVELMAHGILASALAGRGSYGHGSYGEAAEQATRADAMIAATLPSVFATLAGYTGAVDAHIAALVRARELGHDDGARAAASRARRVLRSMRLYAQVFPVGAPARTRLAGELACVEGDLGRGRRLLASAIDRAERLGMPFEEALARLELARACEPEERGPHQEAAHRLLERCGALARWTPFETIPPAMFSRQRSEEVPSVRRRAPGESK